MEQRAARFDGEARRVLDERLTALRAVAADEGANAADSDGTPNLVMPPSVGSLSELADSIAGEASPERAAYPELPALEDFRTLWSAIRSDRQLQQSVAQTPTDAGPLNSAALVSRSIALMRELSPDYLRSFLGYMDDLAWLERMGGVGFPGGTNASTNKKRARLRPIV